MDELTKAFEQTFRAIDAFWAALSESGLSYYAIQGYRNPDIEHLLENLRIAFTQELGNDANPDAIWGMGAEAINIIARQKAGLYGIKSS